MNMYTWRNKPTTTILQQFSGLMIELGLVVSQNRGTQIYRPQYTMVLIMGTPKMVPLILGNPHLGSECPEPPRTDLGPGLQALGFGSGLLYHRVI